jgi:alpha-tubulin suppressor-like RCC1 family protein
MKKSSWFILLFVLAGMLGACGSPAITVTGLDILSSSSETLEAGGTVTLTANVTGTGAFNNAVTWSVVSGTGTLSNITDTSVVLKAPSLGANSVVKVRAVSVQDSSKTKDITFSVSSNGSTVTDVSIEAALVALREGGSSEIQATVLGTGAFSPELNWTLEPSGFGTLSSTTGARVTYTAPTTSFGKVVRIIASSVQDSSKRKTIFLSVNPIKASIAAGGIHSLALTTTGTLLSWGSDFQGQLGDSGSNTNQFLPVTVANATNIVAIAAGFSHSLALKADGTLLSWGNDEFGQLGDGGSNTNQSAPVPVFGATNIVAIAASDSHSLALKANGKMLSWGSDGFGQLGDGGSNTDQSAPVPILNAANIIAIAAGTRHSLALQADGRLLSWGSDSDGQLGDGGTSSDKAAPTFVPNVNNIIAIAAGEQFSLALKADGTMLSWGSDQLGQLGDSTELTDKATPVVVAGVTDVIAIAAGFEYALALKADGTMLSWGKDDAGQLGDGNEKKENKSTFVPVQLAANIVAISAGGLHSLALKADGTLLSWGAFKFGTLGQDLDDPNFNQEIPNPVLLGTFNKIRVP